MHYVNPVMAKRFENHEYLQSVARPVAALAKSYPPGYAGIYAQSCAGAVSLCRQRNDEAGSRFWVLDHPSQACRVAAGGYAHQTGSIGPLEMRTLYLRHDACPEMAPPAPRMLAVSPLLHELVMRVVEMPLEYDEVGHDARIVAALLGEIDWTPIHPVSLPALQDLRLQRIEQMLLHKPGDRSTLEQWSHHLAVSPRTLTRLLRRETDLSFQAWRDHVRAFAAIPMLATGMPLAEIADILGYETAWSFTAMFKRVTGKAPSRYSVSA